MTPEQFDGLTRGDIVRQIGGGGHSWLVAEHYGRYVVLLRHAMATNPSEWEVATKSIHFTVDAEA